VEDVGASALMIAAARARESERSDRLFEDPWAAALASEEGFELLARDDSLRPSGPADIYVVRHRFFDDFALGRVREGARQVVVVAAGLDTRAFRLTWPPEVRLFELDQPGVLAYKQAILDEAGASAACERRMVAVDLRDAWAPALLRAGYDPTLPVVWLAEGLLCLLPRSSLHELLDTTAKLSCVDSALGTDTLSSAVLASDSLPEWSPSYDEADAPLVYGTDRPADLLAKHGWKPTLHWYRDVAEDVGRRWPSAGDSVPPGTLITATSAGLSQSAEIEGARWRFADIAHASRPPASRASRRVGKLVSEMV
jgi:methyltransferase (TIGR00027 family)